MALKTYRLHQVTRFISGLELKNGLCIVDYLNMDLTELEKTYNKLRNCKFMLLNNESGDYNSPSNSTLALIRECCDYINNLCLTNLPYSQMNLPAHNDRNILDLSEIPFPQESWTVYQTSKTLDRIFDYYLSLCEGLLRVKYYYAEFITDYYYRYGIPKNAHDSVRPYIEYEEYLDEKYSGREVPVYYRDSKVVYSDCHAVIIKEDSDGTINRRLWQQLEYRHVGDFMFAEFSDLLRGKLAIKKCINCGRFFVMNSHYSTDYCNNTAPGETTKTCREIGAQNTYREKVKQDPILLAYQRAYKTHYARITSGKLSKAQFLSWLDYANELRDKALNNSIDFNYYLNEIKK